MASGAVHLTGIFPPFVVYSCSAELSTPLDKPKSAILHAIEELTSTFLAAKSWKLIIISSLLFIEYWNRFLIFEYGLMKAIFRSLKDSSESIQGRQKRWTLINIPIIRNNYQLTLWTYPLSVRYFIPAAIPLNMSINRGNCNDSPLRSRDRRKLSNDPLDMYSVTIITGSALKCILWLL